LALMTVMRVVLWRREVRHPREVGAHATAPPQTDGYDDDEDPAHEAPRTRVQLLLRVKKKTQLAVCGPAVALYALQATLQATRLFVLRHPS
jgi:hypothetical protein